MSVAKLKEEYAELILSGNVSRFMKFCGDCASNILDKVLPKCHNEYTNLSCLDIDKLDKHIKQYAVNPNAAATMFKNNYDVYFKLVDHIQDIPIGESGILNDDLTITLETTDIVVSVSDDDDSGYDYAMDITDLNTTKQKKSGYFSYDIYTSLYEIIKIGEKDIFSEDTPSSVYLYHKPIRGGMILGDYADVSYKVCSYDETQAKMFKIMGSYDVYYTYNTSLNVGEWYPLHLLEPVTYDPKEYLYLIAKIDLDAWLPLYEPLWCSYIEAIFGESINLDDSFSNLNAIVEELSRLYTHTIQSKFLMSTSQHENYKMFEAIIQSESPNYSDLIKLATNIDSIRVLKHGVKQALDNNDRMIVKILTGLCSYKVYDTEMLRIIQAGYKDITESCIVRCPHILHLLVKKVCIVNDMDALDTIVSGIRDSNMLTQCICCDKHMELFCKRSAELCNINRFF